jgi:hypothetical protein
MLGLSCSTKVARRKSPRIRSDVIILTILFQTSSFVTSGPKCFQNLLSKMRFQSIISDIALGSARKVFDVASSAMSDKPTDLRKVAIEPIRGGGCRP